VIHFQNIKKFRKRKVFLKKFISLVITLLLLLALTVLSNLCTKQANSQAKFESYTVVPGDTLWGIAERRCGAEKDPRQHI